MNVCRTMRLLSAKVLPRPAQLAPNARFRTLLHGPSLTPYNRTPRFGTLACNHALTRPAHAKDSVPTRGLCGVLSPFARSTSTTSSTVQIHMRCSLCMINDNPRSDGGEYELETGGNAMRAAKRHGALPQARARRRIVAIVVYGYPESENTSAGGG